MAHSDTGTPRTGVDMIASAKRVLVSGSSGFIGSRVVDALRADPRFVAVPACRQPREGARVLDLRAPAGMADALRGIDAVVHCAAGGRAVTVEGTAALLRAAAAAGVARFVHMSSIAVYGDAEGTVTEQAGFVSSGGRGYAAWKSAAEQVCLDTSGMDVVRLRPAIVYGAGSSLWVEVMARRILSGRWGLFGAGGEGICNLVHVGDVAAAAVAAVQAPAAAGAAYNVNGEEHLTWNQYFARLAAAIGAPALRTITPGVWRARSLLALPLKAVARIQPGFAADLLLGAPASGELALFARRATYPISAAVRHLAWHPRVGLEEGLADSVGWLRRRGCVA